jgi:hypothetical protein
MLAGVEPSLELAWVTREFVEAEDEEVEFMLLCACAGSAGSAVGSSSPNPGEGVSGEFSAADNPLGVFATGQTAHAA